MLSIRFCALLTLLAPDAAAAQDVALPAEVLVHPPVGRSGRVAVQVDPVQVLLASGKWKTPAVGEALVGALTDRKWEAVTWKDGAIAHRALGGGYLYFKLDSPEEQVVLLAASGHQSVIVNGEPRTGDIYQNGSVRLPIHLKKGANEFLFQCARGSLKASLSKPKAAAQLDLADTTTPDLIVGRETDCDAAVMVQNASREGLSTLAIDAKLPGGEAIRTQLPGILPFGVRKVGFQLKGTAPDKDGKAAVELTLLRKEGDKWTELDRATLNLDVKKPESVQKHTFRSKIDGSVQYYAIVPAKADEKKGAKPGLVLTLHGAGVEGLGQAACYAPKNGLHIVAPTNRRPFGFDWEDWGRLDALEVLDIASAKLGVDPRRTFVTGHSMGGHGTWHLGVTYPDRFAAIAPSAGWVSFWSYAGMKKTATVSDVEELLLRAANPSDTLALGSNFAMPGIYVLHGDQDDNVPVAQARTMRKVLGEFHRDFAYFEEPGVGHWWGKEGVSGAACVDWPGIFEFFDRRTLPERGKVRSVVFRTASPAVSERCHWAIIEAQDKAMTPSFIQLQQDAAKRRVDGRTENVARLTLDVSHWPAGEKVQLELDGQKLEGLSWPDQGVLRLVRSAGKWSITGFDASLKSPQRGGPFRDAFRNRMLFVYGTKGSPEENSWALAKARFDAEQFWYRGNGSIDVLPDTSFDAKVEPDRNVIVYGNADSNAAWKALLGDSPLQIGRGMARVGEREEKGDDIGCLFVRPRPGSERASVAAVSGTGIPGMRLTDRLPYFVSGVGYPDWMIFDMETLTKGAAAVRGAGYFGNDWKVESGEAAWRK